MLTIPGGSSQRTLRISTAGDSVPENGEHFLVMLLNASRGVIIEQSTTTINILNVNGNDSDTS